MSFAIFNKRLYLCSRTSLRSWSFGETGPKFRFSGKYFVHTLTNFIDYTEIRQLLPPRPPMLYVSPV